MKEYDKTILIDKYITGKLEDTELWEFKADMEKDADLAREVKIRQEIYNTINNKQKMELLNTLSNIQQRSKRKTKIINLYSRQVQAIAASIIVLFAIGAGILTNQLGDTNLNTQLYNEYFADEGSLITTRSEVVSDDAVETGIRLFDSQQYQKAVTILELNPENVTARLYAGLSYMKLEQYDRAEDQFEYILEQKDNIFIDQAEWNLGLSYLAGNKTNEANKIFAKIASENGAYSAKAGEILTQLKNNN